MVMPARGGFRRKVQLSHFIRDNADGTTGAHEIYIAYKNTIQGDLDPEFLRVAYRRIKNTLRRFRRVHKHERVKVTNEEAEQYLSIYITGGTATIGGDTIFWRAHRPKKKRCCSYNSFMHYIYVLRKLGLIEETGTVIPAEGKSGSEPTEWHDSHPTIHIQALDLSNPAWDNIWLAAYG
jgi:hypothetical protein